MAMPGADRPTCTTLGLKPSFGFGDRLGLATPGHVEALRRHGSGIEPIFPQQSIREMARTGRSPRQVMDDALDGMRRAGWTGTTGADADHLKTTEDIDATAEAGFTFFTIDPSDHVDRRADDYDEATLRAKFAAIAGEIDWLDLLGGRSVPLATGTTIVLDDRACIRAAVKYGRALNHALRLSDHIAHVFEGSGRDYEIELSVDETDQPTTLAEHYIIAHECLRGEMRLVSLAPRYIGDFEKGVDYKGDVAALEQSLGDHAAIAALLGPYKLSLHSGSDKLSIYPALARASNGLFHVKTAGTSYLEALRVVARHEPKLFREVIDFARTHYDRDKATYHVSATLDAIPPPSAVGDSVELERLYLELWPEVEPGRGFTRPGRQILHCTFGSVLTDARLGPLVRRVLVEHIDTYTEVLADHFGRHLDALRAGL
jgi:hypothetical protein